MDMSPIRAFLVTAVLSVALAAAPGQGADPAPYEPLNPAKAQSLPSSLLTIQSGSKTHAFTVELADEDEERNTGLMHRAELGADRGMLFDFVQSRRATFWMRNTFIPLDMLFAKSDGEIVHIVENVRPHVEQPVGPDRPVRAVLELNAGTVAKLGIRPGDVIRHAAFGNQAR